MRSGRWITPRWQLDVLGARAQVHQLSRAASSHATAALPGGAVYVATGDAIYRIDPGRTARRLSPRRQVAMLVVLSRGEVLLEKRPPTGIWGGLWSLPEAPVG